MAALLALTPSLAGALTITFAEGGALPSGGSYSGTQDTVLSDRFPTTNMGGLGFAILSANGCFGAFDCETLLGFTGLFGPGVDQIPVGSIINSATLTLQVTNPSDPGSTVSLHRILDPSWSEASTWTSTVGGMARDDVDAVSAADSTFSGASTGAVGVDVTSSLAAWVNAPAANLGWVLVVDDPDTWWMNTSEGGVAPSLTVDYTLVPEPGTGAILAFGLGILALSRRRH